MPDWLNFVGSFAGIVLTFLAGAEVDVPQFRREWRASVLSRGRAAIASTTWRRGAGAQGPHAGMREAHAHGLRNRDPQGRPSPARTEPAHPQSRADGVDDEGAGRG